MKSSIDVSAVVGLYCHFFQRPRSTLPQEIPCVLKDGLSSVEGMDNLLAESLNINCPPELLLAWILGMYLCPSASWEPVVRSTVVHIYANRTSQAMDDRLIQSSWGMKSLGDHMELNALEQADIVGATKARLAASGEKHGIDDVCKVYKSAVSADVKKFCDKKLTTTLLKIAEVFDKHFHESRAAFGRLLVRHGKKTTSSALLRTYIPEAICMLDAMLMRRQLGGGMKGLTCVALAGRDKRAKAERSVADVGFVAISCGKVAVRDEIFRRTGCHAMDELRKSFASVVEWEALYPSEQSQMDARGAQLFLHHDLAWLEGLSGGVAALASLLNAFYEREYNDEIREATLHVPGFDGANLFAKCTALQTKVVEVMLASEAASNIESQAAPLVSMSVGSLAAEMPLTEHALDDDARLDSGEEDDNHSCCAQNKLLIVAATRRQEQVSFMQLSVTATWSQILAKINAHPLVASFKGL